MIINFSLFVVFFYFHQHKKTNFAVSISNRTQLLITPKAYP
jgi:hypothetical protein